MKLKSRFPSLSEDRLIWLQRSTPIVLVALAVILWFWGLREVDTATASDLGLLSVLPVSVIIAYILLLSGTVLLLGQKEPSPVSVGLTIIALIALLYGAIAFVQAEPGYRVVFRHIGVADAIMNTGEANGAIDAYFNWPGFFIFVGILLSRIDLQTLLSVADWAPVVFNLLYLIPLAMIFRAVTTNRRLIWLGLVIFLLTNWPGQDYFSPQAFAYFLYLSILAIILTWLPGSRSARYPGERPVWNESSLRTRRLLWIVVMVIFAAMVPLHQLTPFATIAAVALLAFTGRTSSRIIPVLMLVLVLAWDLGVAWPFIGPRLGDLIGNVGRLGQLAEASVFSRFQGSSLRAVVVGWRIAASILAWSLAAIGWWEARKRSPQLRDVGILVVAPLILLVLQPYGGEMAIRVYFFALPFTAILGASALMKWPGIEPIVARTVVRGSGRHVKQYSTEGVRFSAAVLAIVMILSLAFLITRYGNVRVETFTAADFAAVEFVYETAPEGSLILAAADNLPWKSEHYVDYRHLTFDRFDTDDPERVAVAIRSLTSAFPDGGAYLILTGSQEAYGDALGGFTTDEIESVEDILAISGSAIMVFHSDSARVYLLSSR
jgi:hypothetical protein